MSLAEVEQELCASGSRFEMEWVDIDGRSYRSWKNQHSTLAELARAAASGHAARDLFVYGDERVTYDGWFRAVARLAHALVGSGVGKGDRVAIAMRNYPEWPVAFFAVVSAGAIAVPLNAWWTGAELRHGLAQSGSRVLICDEERWQRVAPERGLLPALERIHVCRAAGSRPLGATSLEDAIGPARAYGDLPWADLPTVDIAPDDDATILYTSGTTGVPKGALASHRSNLAYVLGAAYTAARAARRRGEPAPPPQSNPPVLLSAVPLFHVTGLNACLLPLISAGGTFVMMHKWDAGAALALIEREKVTVTGGVPTIAWELLDHPDLGRYDLRSLRSVFYGGMSSPPELARRIAAGVGASPAQGWGMTETCAVGMRHDGEDYLNRPASCGPANPGTELKIVGAEGVEATAPDVVGELWVRGVQVIRRYWDDQDATDAAIRDGWLRTGDLARLDEEGFCFIVGRAKDVIIRGGENIYPVEVENALLDHPAVAEAAVVGVAHPTLGEEVAAAVCLAAGAGVTEAELRTWMGARLAAFKTPVKIAFFDTALPRTASGKILKQPIRATLEGRG